MNIPFKTRLFCYTNKKFKTLKKNKQMNVLLILFFLMLLVSNNAFSENKHDIQTRQDTQKSFSGKMSVGFSKESGNVDKQQINYGVELVDKKDNNEFTFKLEGDFSKTSGTIDQDKIEVSVLDIFEFNKVSGLYGKTTFYRNEFQGYEQQWRLGTGYLHYWFRASKKKYFKTRIGYQLRRSNETTGQQETQNYLLLGGRSSYPVMENISAKIELNYEVDFSNSSDYEMDGFIAFVFHVNKNIDIKMDYKVDYSHIPVEEKQSTDTSLITKVIYKF